jgi:hypothetical protein
MVLGHRASQSSCQSGKPLHMAWETKFWKPVKLKDGRTVETLGEARALLHELPEARRENEDWQLAIELLARASEATSLTDDALPQTIIVLKAARLV